MGFNLAGFALCTCFNLLGCLALCGFGVFRLLLVGCLEFCGLFVHDGFDVLVVFTGFVGCHLEVCCLLVLRCLLEFVL